MAELEPCVDIHNSGLYAQFGQRFHFAFVLTLSVTRQRTARNPVRNRKRHYSLKHHSVLKRAVSRHPCMTTKSFLFTGWCCGDLVFYFPKQYLVDVQSRIASLQKLTRCYFMALEDAVERAPVFPFFCRLCKIKQSWRKWFSTVQEALNHRLQISCLAGRYIRSATLHSTRTPTCARGGLNVSHVPLAKSFG